MRDPLRILVVIAHGNDLHVQPIRPAAERKRLEEALGELIKANKVEVEYLIGPTAARLDPNPPKKSIVSEDLNTALRTKLSQKPRIDVVHFIGHAGPRFREPGENVDREEMVLYSENAQGEYEPLGGRHLVGILDGLRDQGLLPRLFILNACQTGDVAGTESLVGLIPKLIIDGGLPAVIGMQYPITDTAARDFTREFYTALIQHGQVDWAISVARNVLAQEREDQPDWGTPVLYLQSRDGFIFKTY